MGLCSQYLKEKPTCKHKWILNDVYAQWIDLRVEIDLSFTALSVNVKKR